MDDDNRGKAYGFHKAMDTAGAALGLMLAAGIVFLTQRNVVDLRFDTYRWMIVIGIIPAFLSLVFLSSSRSLPEAGRGLDATPTSAEKSSLDKRFKVFVVLLFLFTLGNSSDAFIVLRRRTWATACCSSASCGHVQSGLCPVFLPAGILSDRLGRKKVIIVGWIIYALVYLGFADAGRDWMIWALFAFYGFYYGLTQGVYRALVCDLVPEEHRGTAFGVYNGVVGMTLLPASLIAGWLWQSVGPAAPFYFGAALAGLSAIGLLLFVEEP